MSAVLARRLEVAAHSRGLVEGTARESVWEFTSGSKECQTCGRSPGKFNAKLNWVELPAGVRFDPSDEELLEHLAAKIGRGAATPHPLIDDFISSLDGEDGICGTHPEKLPGVKKGGRSCHFFHRPAMAYTTGTRKRRRIQSDEFVKGGGDTRWHKTGKTRPIQKDGRIMGFKKIMVLYCNTGKKTKNVKTNWVMHQYHLGEQEEEKDGELVVCKVFFQIQPRSCPGGRKASIPVEDDEDCKPSEIDIGFQERPAPGRDGNSPAASGVTRGMPPKTPKLYAPSRPGKQPQREPVESISEISLEQRSALVTGVASKYSNFEVCCLNSYQLPHGPMPAQQWESVEGPNPDGSSGHQNVVEDSVVARTVSYGEDESFQTVNLEDDHQPWEAVVAPQAEPKDITIDFDPAALFCNEELNGDPLVQDSSYADVNWRSCALEVGCSLEDPVDEVELCTIPDLLECPEMTSQDWDWIGKSPVVDPDNSDSQSTT